MRRALASWLLTRCLPGPEGRAILGDLQEQLAAGRSSLWFWRQVVYGVAVAALEDIRRHRLEAFGAVVVGLVAYYAAIRSAIFLRYALSVITNGGVTVGDVWITLPTRYSRWLWEYGPHLFITANMLTATFSGWIVGQVYRRHPASMVIAFASALLTLWVVGVGMNVLAWGVGSRTRLLFANVLIAPSFALIGGFHVMRRDRDPETTT